MNACTILAGLVLGLPAAALGCGACVEDKIAATYDYAVVSQAAARHHVVVFAAVEGPGDPARESRELRKAAARAKGVDRESIRAADAPHALSFALDPRLAAPEAALSEITRAAALRGVRLSLIRVVR
jgi:hypothetical protein